MNPHRPSPSRSLRRRRGWPWYAAGAFLVAGGVAAALLASPLLRVAGVDVTGTDGPDMQDIVGRFLRANMLLLDTEKEGQELLADFPRFQEARIAKQWPHRVSVAVTERSPRGIWCRQQACTLWDDSGARWGTAAPSVGPLLLQVRDERSEESENARMLEGLLAAVDGLPELGLRARLVTMPDAEPGGMRIATDRGFELYFDALSDVAGQLETLGIFLADRAKDPMFKPAYIDLRTPGRIYYK